MEREAFERARSVYGTGAYDDATLEFVFPELKESEDERIRKWIVDELKDSLHDIEIMYSGDYDNGRTKQQKVINLWKNTLIQKN